MSINPGHVEKILSGEKRYEFRKRRCREEADRIVIYATSPVRRVVAEAVVEDVIEGDVLEVWRLAEEYAGVSKESYLQYYEGQKKAIAYKLSEIIKYPEPKQLGDFGVTRPPQSFRYLPATT
jgi:predicted transcriptional regulator